MELSDLKCTFVITENVKQGRVGTHLKPVAFYRNTLRKPESFEMIVNYFLAMSNLMAQQAKTPYPGGARMS